jgi:hypothetical protein
MNSPQPNKYRRVHVIDDNEAVDEARFGHRRSSFLAFSCIERKVLAGSPYRSKQPV